MAIVAEDDNSSIDSNSSDESESRQRLVHPNHDYKLRYQKPPRSINNYTFWDFFKFPIMWAFDKAFPADGVDKVYKMHEGVRVHWKKVPTTDKGCDLENYRSHWATRLASFFGLPTRRLNDEDTSYSLANLFYNLMSWRDKTARWKNFLRSFLLPINLIVIPFKFALNVVKLVTEFLPDAFRGFFDLTAKKAASVAKLAKTSRRSGESGISFKWLFFSGLSYGLVGLRKLSFLAHYLGEALTSPIDHVRRAWKIDDQKMDSISTSPVYRYVRRALLVTLAIASTVAMFIIAAPVAVTLFKATLLPAVVNHLPSFVTNKYLWLADKIGPIATTVGNAILLNPAVAYVTHLVGLSAVYGASTPAASIAAAVGLAVTTVGTAINYAIDTVWSPIWHEPSDADLNRKNSQNQIDPIRLNDNIFTNTFAFVKRLFKSSNSGLISSASHEGFEHLGEQEAHEDEKQYVSQGNRVSAENLQSRQLTGWKDVKGSATSSVQLGASRSTLLGLTATSKTSAAPQEVDDLQNRSKVGFKKAFQS